ncbi:MAG TPA: hypothetical protein VH834_15190 [Solirubrobacteraceae bacterium]|jgi:hypothetical protein
MSEEERHHGSFAEGEADPDKYPEDENVGTFAEGEADPADYADEDRAGRFSEGEEELGEDDPEKHREGSFGDENE